MAVDVISYERLVEKALLSVVREALKITQDNGGLPGNHHFYITFKTKYEGTVLSDRLRDAYPEDMTIVLQHEFSGLETGEDGFSVTLSFSDVPERITVPFDAITSFADPHARFAVSFRVDLAQAAAAQEEKASKPFFKSKKKSQTSSAAREQDGKTTDNVVSLSAFRKKK